MSGYPSNYRGEAIGPVNRNDHQNQSTHVMHPTSVGNSSTLEYQSRFPSYTTGYPSGAHNYSSAYNPSRIFPPVPAATSGYAPYNTRATSSQTYAGQRMPPVPFNSTVQPPSNLPIGMPPPPFQAHLVPSLDMNHPELTMSNASHANTGPQTQSSQLIRYPANSQNRPRLDHASQNMFKPGPQSVVPSHQIPRAPFQPTSFSSDPSFAAAHQHNPTVPNSQFPGVQNVQNNVNKESYLSAASGQFTQTFVSNQAYKPEQNYLVGSSNGPLVTSTAFLPNARPIYPPPTQPATTISTSQFHVPPAAVQEKDNAVVFPHQFQMYSANTHPPASQTNNSFTQNVHSQFSSEDILVKNLLQKYECQKKSDVKQDTKIAVVEFRAFLSSAFHILQELTKTKEELEDLVSADDKCWDAKMGSAVNLRDQLCDLINVISNPEHVTCIVTKLQRIKKKREQKRLQNLNFTLTKKQAEQRRAEIHAAIDRWHEALREKALQNKREEEMKKEADNILSEVRKKIYEAKRTIEKLKILEKLRQARRENAVKKGMFVLPKQDRNFEVKISNLRDIMLRQLADYENEEKALKVMLETEQEGQREEEENWKMKKLKEIQDNKHANILSCLFGDLDSPPETSSIYLFWQHHNAASASVENLVNIRHMWDMFLVPQDGPGGSSIPLQWVVPEPPSSDLWASVLSKRN